MIPDLSQPAVGHPTTNLGDSVIITILQILSIASQRIVSRCLVKAHWHEDRITDQLREKMVEVKTEQEDDLGTKLILRILPTQFGVSHTERGKIDIAIIYSFREDEYFAIECKKLSDKRKGLDREYVINGMMRFVTAKYGYGHQWGMMVGYVISGTCERAIEFVQGRIDEYRTLSLRQTGFCPRNAIRSLSFPTFFPSSTRGHKHVDYAPALFL